MWLSKKYICPHSSGRSGGGVQRMADPSKLSGEEGALVCMVELLVSRLDAIEAQNRLLLEALRHRELVSLQGCLNPVLFGNAHVIRKNLRMAQPQSVVCTVTLSCDAPFISSWWGALGAKQPMSCLHESLCSFTKRLLGDAQYSSLLTNLVSTPHPQVEAMRCNTYGVRRSHLQHIQDYVVNEYVKAIDQAVCEFCEQDDGKLVLLLQLPTPALLDRFIDIATNVLRAFQVSSDQVREMDLRDVPPSVIPVLRLIIPQNADSPRRAIKALLAGMPVEEQRRLRSDMSDYSQNLRAYMSKSDAQLCLHILGRHS